MGKKKKFRFDLEFQVIPGFGFAIIKTDKDAAFFNSGWACIFLCFGLELIRRHVPEGIESL